VPALLEVENVSVDFATPQGVLQAVRDVSFAIAPGEVLGVVGESGSGKSVSSLAILRLLPIQARVSGRIEFRGEDLLSLPEAAMRDVRGAGISMIFQEPMTALNPVMRVGDQVAEAVLAHARQPRVSKSDAWRHAVEALRTVAILEPERRARDYPHQLSGGQRQRVSLMRALMLDPDILLMDEPLGALDPMIRADLQDDLKIIFQSLAKTVVLVTHDLSEAAFFSDRIILMNRGHVVQEGQFCDLIEHPADPFVGKFVHAQLRRLTIISEQAMASEAGRA